MKICDIITLNYYQFKKVIYGDTYEDCLKTLIAYLTDNKFSIFGLKRVAQGNKGTVDEFGIESVIQYTFEDDENIIYQSVKTNKPVMRRNQIELQVLKLDDTYLNNWCKPYITQAEGYAAIGVAEKGVDRRIYVKNEKGNIVTLTIRSVAITDPNKVAIYVEEEEK